MLYLTIHCLLYLRSNRVPLEYRKDIKHMGNIAEAIYRMIEAIDGEKDIKIIPYKYAEAIKLYALRWIK